MKTILSILTVCMLSQIAFADKQIYSDNIVVVFDASGSMEGRMINDRKVIKLDAAKNALKQVLLKVNQNTNIGIVVFGNVSNEWVYPLSPKNSASLIKAIDSIRSGGGTPLGAYMKTGADKLLEQRSKQFGYGTYRLLVVTDGEAGDSSLVDSYTPDIISRGIIIDVIGVSMDGQHTLAQKVHSYRKADDAQSLTTAISEIVAEIGKTDNNIDNTFEITSSMDEQFALSAIKSLSKSGNHPIGEQPPREVDTNTSASLGSTSASGYLMKILGFLGGAVLVVIGILVIKNCG